MAMDVEIALLIRFSYPALSGWTRMGATIDRTRAALWDEARLARRWQLFETICAPSLRAQTDRDLSVGLLVGEGMPPAWRARLDAVARGLPGGRVIALPPMHNYAAATRAFAAIPQDGRPRATVRLDDDDALARGTVARLRGAMSALIPGRTAPLAVAFNHGVYLDPAAGTAFDAVERLPVSCGTALWDPSGRDNVYARNHRLLPQFFDTYTEAQGPAWLRTIHGDNDSEPTVLGRRDTMDPGELPAVLRGAFGLELRA